MNLKGQHQTGKSGCWQREVFCFFFKIQYYFVLVSSRCTAEKSLLDLKKIKLAQTGIMEFVEHRRSAKPEVASWIPGQGTCLGGAPGAWLGCMQGVANGCSSLTWIFLSLPFSLPVHLSNIK